MQRSDFVLIAGGALSLLAGVATADLGLTPLRHALAGEAPSLDTAVADLESSPRPAELNALPPEAAPALVSWVEPPAAYRQNEAAPVERATVGDGEQAAADGAEAADDARAESRDGANPSPEPSPAFEAADAGATRADQESEAPGSDAASPAADPPTLTSG